MSSHRKPQGFLREVNKAFITLLTTLALSNVFAAQEPIPMPVFLKLGFSSVLEFDEAPTEIVVGNSSAFQIEKLKDSIVVRPLAKSASTNAFVYFKTSAPRLLVLTAADDVTPTYYRRVASLTPKVVAPTGGSFSSKQNSTEGLRVGRIEFQSPHDFLTIDVTVTANSSREISPRWDLARLNFRDRSHPAMKVWSSRREVMRDSSIRARFIFTKPAVPADLKEVTLSVPTSDGRILTTKLRR